MISITGAVNPTINELEKRIAELVLWEVANAPNRIAENARIIAAYFSRYEGPHE
jgi:hypothetical protein